MLTDGLELRLVKELVLPDTDIRNLRIIVRDAGGFLNAKYQLGARGSSLHQEGNDCRQMCCVLALLIGGIYDQRTEDR